MNFIQTLYINNEASVFKDSFGWAKPSYHLMSWGLSSLTLNERLGKIHFFGNKAAAEILINILDLPYDSINTKYHKFSLPNKNLWALPKIFTYAAQKAPFLHIDGDVFIFSPFSEILIKGDLVAQNEEIATDYYISTQQELKQHFTYLPECVMEDFKKSEPIRAVNAGILGGSDIGFFQHYTKEAFEYVEQNLTNLSKINADRFNVFFEQHLFYSLAKKKNKQISYLFPDIVNDNQYQHLGEFHEVPCSKRYLHLLGHYKRDEITCLQMASKLRELYPGHYERIIRICHDKKMDYPFKKLYTYYFNDGKSYNELVEGAERAYSKSIVRNFKDNYAKKNKENIRCLEVLSNLFKKKNQDIFNNGDIESLLSDYESFCNDLIEKLDETQFMKEELYGRDIKSQRWYCMLYGENGVINSDMIVRCKDNFIVESNYDWAAIYNNAYRVGVGYYEGVRIEPGTYFNLVVQEASDYDVSLYDIDEMEKLILKYIETPRTINSVLKEMEQYIEDDVLQHYYESFQELVFSFLKQLVVKKAIAPYE